MKLDELKQFEALSWWTSPRLAVSKCDMLDDELMDEMREKPSARRRSHCIYLRCVSAGLTELEKDVLWRAIND